MAPFSMLVTTCAPSGHADRTLCQTNPIALHTEVLVVDAVTLGSCRETPLQHHRVNQSHPPNRLHAKVIEAPLRGASCVTMPHKYYTTGNLRNPKTLRAVARRSVLCALRLRPSEARQRSASVVNGARRINSDTS